MLRAGETSLTGCVFASSVLHHFLQHTLQVLVVANLMAYRGWPHDDRGHDLRYDWNRIPRS